MGTPIPVRSLDRQHHDMSIRRRSRLHSWALPAFLLVTVLVSLSLISAEHRSEAAALAAPLAWVSQRLTPERRTQRQLTSARPTAEVPEEQPEPQQPALQQGQTQKQPQEQQQHSDHTQGQGKPAPAQHPQDWKALHSTLQCHEPEFGAPEQRVCVFDNLVLYNGQVIYVQPDPNDSVPPIKIAWLKKFEGDDFFHPTVVNQSHLGFSWDTAQVEELPRVGLFHQQHYSNFYHMFSEVAPTIHYLMCKYLGDCFYSRDSKTQLVWIQEKRPDIPPYIMLDTVVDTFKCLTPRPVWHKDDAHLHNKVFVLRKAVVGVGGEVRVFHEWGERLKHFREPPKAPMVAWRQRMADCFGYGFTQAVAPTDPLRVLFINRHYREGRMILNQAELAHEIERVPEAKAFPSVEVKLHNLNGDDKLLDQAALFWNASLLIWPHGATMALTALLPRGAQAIEVIPWVEEDKARQAEWVQAIRHSFSLDIGLHMVQNKDRRRYMFNQDMLAGYQQYRDASPEQKVALLERGECPPGIDPFICPIWWNHWQASVNLDWATLEPAVKAALAQLAKLRRAGGIRPASQAAQPEAAAGTASAEAAAAAGAAAGEVAGGAALQQQGSNATAEAQAAR